MSEVSLRAPISWHNEEVSQLTFREPTGEDLVHCGTPFDMFLPEEGTDQTVMIARINAQSIGKLIARLASTEEGTPAGKGIVKKLSAPDFMKCQEAVLSFFDMPASAPVLSSSTDTSTSPVPGSASNS